MAAFSLSSCSDERLDSGDKRGAEIHLKTDFDKKIVSQFMETHGGERTTFGGQLATGIWFLIISAGSSSGPNYPMFDKIHLSGVSKGTGKTVFTQEINYGKNQASMSAVEGIYDLMFSLSVTNHDGKYTQIIERDFAVSDKDIELSIELSSEGKIEVSVDGRRHVIEPINRTGNQGHFPSEAGK